MRRRTRFVVLVLTGAVMASGVWGVRALLVHGRRDPDEALRAVQAAIADVEAGRRTTPIIGELASTGEAPVTFLAQSSGGRAPRIVSDVTGWGEHIDGTFDFTAGTMTRVGDTEWYSLQAGVAPRARIEYQIAYGQTDYQFDPHNPRRSVGPEVGGAAASEFVMPGYLPPAEFADPSASPGGIVSEAAVADPCKVLVYTPAGQQHAMDYPLAVFLDLRSGPMSRVLDWLIARREIEPVVGVFVGPASRGDERCSAASLRTFVAGKLLKWLASRHCVSSSADEHAVLAISFGAKDAVDIALGSPDAFGRLGLLIPGRRISRGDIAAIAGHHGHRLRAAILAGRYDYANLPTARGVRQALADAGHAVTYTEVPEGHSAVTWRNHLRDVLVSLFGDRNAGLSVETSQSLGRSRPSNTVVASMPSRTGAGWRR